MIRLEDVSKMSWRRFEDVFKRSWRRLEDVLKAFLQEVLKTSWRRLENILKSWRCIAKTNILVLTKTSWRRLEDVIWRRKARANIFVLVKTSWRRLMKTKTKDVFKTSLPRRMFAGSYHVSYYSFLKQVNYNFAIRSKLQTS